MILSFLPGTNWKHTSGLGPIENYYSPPLSMSVIDDQRGVVTLCSCSVTLSNVYNVAAEEKFFPFFRCRLDSGFLFILFSSLIMYPLLHGIG